MKEKVLYKILDVSKDGWMTVEYKIGEISVTRSFWAPLHKSEAIIEQVIKQNIPINNFIAQKNDFKNIDLKLKDQGEFEVDFNDFWFDTQISSLETLDLSNEKADSKV